jgi:hypothetical protein
LAGIRADKHHHLTFPCKKHSGIAGWLTISNRQKMQLFEIALVHRCGGSTLNTKNSLHRVSRLTTTMNMVESTKTGVL